MSALVLALVSRHDVLVRVQQPVAPVAVLVDADISLVQSEGIMIMSNTSYTLSLHSLPGLWAVVWWWLLLSSEAL